MEKNIKDKINDVADFLISNETAAQFIYLDGKQYTLLVVTRNENALLNMVRDGKYEEIIETLSKEIEKENWRIKCLNI